MRRASSCKATASAVALLTIALLVGPTATAALAAPPAQKLAFTTGAQTLTAGVISNTITVQMQANNGLPVNASSTTTVTLTKTSSGGLFRNTADTATITTVTIATGTNSASFKYKDTLAGTASITASATGLSSGTQNETVNPAALDHIAISPKTSTIASGASQIYSVTGFDQFNNSRGNVTGAATFAISPDGSCNSPTASCTANALGAHTVTATVSAIYTDTATLTVIAGASKLGLTTAAQTLTAGVTSNTITVQLQTSGGSPVNASSAITVNLATDSTGGIFRNTLDNATITSVTIASGTNSASFKYRDTHSGTAAITASATGLSSATQSETVNPAALDHITISPTSSTIGSGGSQIYAVTAFDQFNNSRGNVTGSTTFSITPDGSCNNTTASCTATALGAHTVTATNGGKTATATLTVQAVATKLAFTLGAQTLTAGVTSGTITVQMQEAGGAAVNATSDVVVSLATGSSGGLFRNTADTATITSVTITAGSSSTTFKYKDTLAGSSTITASATGLTSATQTDTVNPAPLDHITIAPKTSSVTAGVGQAYTATGFDQFNNSRGEVTGATTFSITPNGSCSGSTCQATIAGSHTVTGTNAGKTDTATLTVNAGPPTSITLSPASSSVLAGASQTYTATAADQFGNALGDVTAQATFSVAPDGSCTANTCSATVAGAHTVTATDGFASGHANLTIKAAVLDHIVVSPADATIASGGSQTYTVEGFDVYGNSRGDITFGTTSYSITPNGSCTSNVCTATVSGDHTVKAQRGTKSATAILHVTPGGTTSIVISPSSSTVLAGTGVTYTAQAFDSIGNPIGDVTSETTFSVAPDGSCTANTCSATVAGAHTVTGTDGSFTDDASMTVSPEALDHIVVSPADATIASGGSQTYTVEGFDVYGNSRGDITFGTTSYSITPNGSCTSNVCTATVSGDHTVKAQRGTKSATAILHVTPGGTTSIVISPSSSTVLAGTGVTYTAQAFDSIGNPIGDVTSETTFSVAPDGSCTANTCSATVAGAHTVTGTDGSFTDDASMTVSPEALDHIVVSPADATIASGGSQTYTVEGFDVYGNSRGDITFGTTSYSITPNGSCTSNVCTATVSGDHTVKAQRGTKSATAILHVTPGGTTSIVISPSSSTVLAGTGVTYTAQAFDSIGNPIGDVTSETTFSVAPDGSCTANTCSATVAGAHTVTGTDGSFTDDASMTVSPEALDHIVVSPADATIASGGSQTYTVEGFDVYGNSRGDITFGTTSYSITPNGSCTSNVCTATVSGDHTVKAQRGTKSATAILHVTPGGTTSIVISPSSSTVLAGTGVTYTAQAFDSIGNPIGDVTSETTFSIAPDGSCTANTCSATVAGAHTVTGTDGSFTDDASMTVSPAGLDHIVVTPHDSTIAIGDSQTYTVEGFDVYGNSRGDLTSGTTFTITPDGSCTANVCTASIAGLHSVRAQRGKVDTATLHVGGATPVIGSFSPTAAKVGASVIITGSGFAGATDVAFNGTAATFAIDSDTQITTSVPNGALTGKISVAGPGGTALSSGTFKVQPSITGFSPASGPVGTTVVITGSAFTGATAVSFNGIAAVFTVDSYSQITATVPCCGASGKVKVTTPGGNVSSATAFKVPASISTFTPGSGPVGTTVVITGIAFTGATAVAVNGIVATTFTVDSDTQITVVVPAGATTGKIKVTTGGGAVSSSTNFTVTP